MIHVERVTPIVKLNLKNTMLKSNLCDYIDAYMLVKGIITVANPAAADIYANNTNKKVIFKTFSSIY